MAPSLKTISVFLKVRLSCSSRTYGQVKSPMVLFNTAYWSPAAMNFDDPNGKRKQAYPLLRKLATEKGFDDYLLLSDDAVAIVQFIKDHPPVA